MEVSLEQLTSRNPDRIRWEPKWSDYRLLYRGGDDMLRAAGQLVNTRISSTLQTQVTNALTPQAFSGLRNRRFLYQLEGEPDPVYYALWNRAYYLNYLSAILDYFRHWLFSEEPNIRPRAGDDAPDWWESFFENANGAGKNLCDFARDVFLDVLVCRRAGWLIGRNTAIAEQGDDESVVLTPYPAEQIYDWERDSAGELKWVVLGTRQSVRDFPERRLEVEQYTFIDRDTWQTWQVKKGTDPNGTDDELIPIGEGQHGLGKVPFVMIEIPEGLWITDKLAMPCTDLFNKHNRLTSALINGCVVQPWMKTDDHTKSSITFGEGYYVKLKPGNKDMGIEGEDFGWKSPDIGPLEFIAKQIIEQRDEIYRIVHQMALAVDSKSIGAIARSGASKIEDRKASEIILAAYGGYVTEALLRTVRMLSDVYGDDIEWELDGYKNFDVSSLDEEIQIASLAASMNFKSQTAKEELELKVIGRLLSFVDEKTMETIEQETRDGYDQEQEALMAPQILPGGIAPPIAPNAQTEQKSPMEAIKSPKNLGVKPMGGDKAVENSKAAYGQ